jgi:RNA polymerase sigma-70 factor (ECF subfamily)
MNERKFDELHEECYRKIKIYCYSLLGNEDLAEEATTWAFVQAWQKIHTYNPEFPFIAWIRQIAHNRSIDLIRANERRREVVMEESDRMPTVSAPVFDDPQLLQLNACLEKLREQDPELCVAYVMKHAHNYTWQEVADFLSLPGIEAARTALRRACKTLRNCMEFQDTGKMNPQK